MKNKKIFLFVSLFLVFLMTGSILYPIWKTKAAGLTIARDYLNRNQENLSSGVTHEIIFRPATAIDGDPGANSIIIIFPLADGQDWCRTATSLTAATTSLRESATPLPGTLSASCTQGNDSSTYDTITITGVDDLLNSVTYGVRISGALGTPANTSTGVITVKTNNGSTDIDSSNVVADIIASDQVSISGHVDPTLSFAIDDTSIGFGAITSAAVRYATANESGSASESGSGDPVQLTVSTNADDGLVIEVRDFNANSASGLYSSEASTTLTSVASTDVSAGSEEFGVYAKNSSSVDLTISDAFDHDASGETAISTTFQTLASSIVPVSSVTVDVQPVAGVAGTTPSGNYADTLTIIATGRF